MTTDQLFDPESPDEYLGKGLYWPPEEDPNTGDFRKAEGEESVERGMFYLIGTRYGEAVLDEARGTRAEEVLFSNEFDLADVVSISIKQAIQTYERRAALLGISGMRTGERAIGYVIRYRIKATGDPQSVIYPFNAKPEEV